MIRIKLSLMLFLQYMMYAVWWVPLAAYLTNLEVSSFEKSMILSSMAIGCLISPVVGMLADRFFAGQKVLAVLNSLNAVMLFLAGTTNNPDFLFICLLIAMLGTSYIAIQSSRLQTFITQKIVEKLSQKTNSR